MILKGKEYINKEAAGKELLELCKNKQSADLEEIGEYRGLKMLLELDTFRGEFRLKLKSSVSYKVDLGTDIFGNITRIDNVIKDMNKELEKRKEELENLEKQFENAKVDVNIPFEKEDELKEKTEKLNNINALLNLNEKEKSEIIDDEPMESLDEENVERECQDYDRNEFR